MKKILATITAAAVIAMAGSALAANNTLTVQASVTGTCKFSSATSTLDFGALDPSVASNVDASSTTLFWCTKGVTETIAATNGSNWSGSKRQMKDAAVGGVDLIPYTLSLVKDGNSNAGPGAPRTLTINGQVLGSDYAGKTASSYSDTVTLSITP
jgi:spore coat protein U-like protein